MNIYIITGASSGIGGAIARHLVEAREGVISISRSENIPLNRIAETNSCFFRHFTFDLTETDKIPELMKKIFASFKEVKLNGIALVNNAGTIDPIGPSGQLDVSGIEAHLKTNLVAPAILINEFIRLSRPLKVSKSILNISSGAAYKPYAGWSNYCSSKAGLDMLTRSIAMEQSDEAFPVRIISLAPGIVETSMQQKIRATSAEQFPMQKKFTDLYENRGLSDPDAVAARIIPLIFSDQPESGTVSDLRYL
ncbi:Benzil reductase [anaerobic digester metagenome]